MELVEHNEDNVFLQGNRAPVEERAFTNLEVQGQLPPELEGMFLRNGPNPRFEPRGRYHWWDGDGMIHGLHLQDGKASYRGRYVQTKGYSVEQREGKAIWRGMMYPPEFSNPHGSGKNPSNTHMMMAGGRLLSLWEGGRPYRLRLPELSTEGSERFGGKLTGHMSAHPHRDMHTGEFLFHGYSAMPPYCHFGVVDAAGALVHYEPIDLPAASMMHDFVFTEHYVVIVDFPVKIRPQNPMQGKPAICWEPEFGSRFGVVPRRGSNADVRWFEAPPGYVFHFANAYEEGHRIIIQGSRSERSSFGSGTGAATQVQGASSGDDTGCMHRWEIDLNAGTIQQTQIDDLVVDFVRVNPYHFGRPYRYTFGSQVEDRSEPGTFDHYIKYDHDRGTHEIRSLGKHTRVGESVFVPRPGAREEDDGWVLGLSHDEQTEQSELVVINAKDFTGEAQARVKIPERVPYGFHAEWVTAEEIASQPA